MGIHLHKIFINHQYEIEICPAETEAFCSPHKLRQEMWNEKRELAEEPNGKVLEARGGTSHGELLVIQCHGDHNVPTLLQFNCLQLFPT